MSQEHSPATHDEAMVLAAIKHLEDNEMPMRALAVRNLLSARSERGQCKAILVDSPGVGEMKWCEAHSIYFGKDQSCPYTPSAIAERDLLQRIHDDLKIRAEFNNDEHVVDLSSGIWRDLVKYLEVK